MNHEYDPHVFALEALGKDSTDIKLALSRTFPITVTSRTCQAILRYCYGFEGRGSHPEALNSPFLGVAKIYFLEKDIQEFLDIFEIENMDLKRTKVDFMMNQLSNQDLKKVLNKLDVIDLDRKVASDSFNIFLIYVLHSIAVAPNIKPMEREMTMVAILKILQYKFFTSLVVQRYKLGANIAVMQATITNLSNKHDIIKYGTWKKVIEARATELTQDTSIHWGVISTFEDDSRIFYIITDVQTRIRNQINIITRKYYETKENGEALGSYGTTGTDLDGKKLILSTVSALDAMTSNLSGEILNTRKFLDQELIRHICSLFKGLHANMFRLVLAHFSQVATDQAKEGTLDVVKMIKGEVRYLGASALVSNLIQKSYRHCIHANVNMSSKIQILRTVKDAYSSSRITDPDILAIRESVGIIVAHAGVSARPATVASLKIAFVLYLIVKSFNYL